MQRGTIRRWSPTFFTGCIVLILHGLPGGELQSVPWWAQIRLDALLHMAMFALLSGVLLCALTKGQSRSGASSGKLFSRNVLAVLLVSLVYGAGLEWAQSLVFYDRGADLTDLLSDVLGAGFGALGFWALYLRCSPRNKARNN